MRKVISALLCFVIIVSACPTIIYANNSEPVIEQYNELVREFDNDKSFVESIIIEKDGIVQLDGTETSINSNLAKVNKTAMVSLNSLCKFIDAEYSDDTQAETGYSTITYDDRKVWYDENTGLIDIQTPEEDNIIILDEVPYQDNNETMVPLEQFADALGYDTYEEDGNYLLTRPYQTCRLLVSTKKNNIDTQNAVASVRDEDTDITILQYDNETDTINAQEKYSSLGYTVEPDGIITTYNDETIEGNAYIMEPVDDHNESGASEALHIDDMNDYLSTQKLNNVIIGVIDTGVCSTHPDLKDRVISADINFSDSEQKNSEDDNGHGTHVCGIVADNTLDNVKILAIKALNSNGSGTDYQIYCAIQYAVDNGAKVLNLSLGRYGKSDLLTNIVKELWNKNITVVCAAGNNSWYAEYFTPAGIEECITVSSTDNDKYTHKLRFPNFGYPVDCCTPGYMINSTWLNNEYKKLSGTSMSSPFCAAAVSMMYSYNNKYTSKYIHDKVRESCVPFGNGKYNESSYMDWRIGFLDCRNLINYSRSDMPVSNVKSGYYADNFFVSLTCNEPNAEIYYTTDGTRPTKENGTLYTEPFEITHIMMLLIVSYTNGKPKSDVNRYDYYLVTIPDENQITINSNGIITAFDYIGEYDAYLKIPETVKGITVTGIGDNVFRKNKDIIVVNLPKSCKSLGNYAFGECPSVQKVEAPGVINIGEGTFEDCYKLSYINTDNLERIGNKAFYYCIPLKMVFTEKLLDIPNYAFTHCEGLGTIDLSNAVNIGTSCFEACYNLTEVYGPNVESIGNKSFYYSGITNASFPKLITAGKYSFSSSGLKTISIPAYNNRLPDNCFSDCYNLIQLDMPNITEIGTGCFASCKRIKEFEFENVINVSNGAFSKCDNLISLKLPNCKNFGSIASDKLKVLVLPLVESIAGIKSDALEYLYLPNVKTITDHIQCINLKYLYMPRLTNYTYGYSSSDGLFYDCLNLEEIYLPLLKKSDSFIFYTSSKDNWNNKKLKKIFVPNYNEKVTITGSYTFEYSIDKDLFIADNVLGVNSRGINLYYYWYYSPNGKEGTFSKIDVSTSEFIPDENGYYYVSVISDFERKYDSLDERTKISNIIYYEKNYETIRNNAHDVLITADYPFLVRYNDMIDYAQSYGSNYSFSKRLVDGTKVSISCDDNSFKTWNNESNRVLSTYKNYSFYVGNDVTIVGKSSIKCNVSFYNANGDLISEGKYSRFYSSNYPEAPKLYAHTFVGWDKTVNEINAAISNNKPISVNAVYEKDLNYCNLNLNGAVVSYTNSDNYNGSNSYRILSLVSIKPFMEQANFMYWVDENNEIISYEKDYQFYITKDTTVSAVYGNDIVVQKPIVRITGSVKEDNRITFLSEYYVPDDCEVIETGIILTKDISRVESTFVIGVDNVLKGTSTQTTNCGTYSLTKKNVYSNEIWKARSYIVYKNANGIIRTIYSSIYG